MSKVKYAAWEVGPSWDMVENWLKSFSDTTKRKVTLTCGYHVFRNGSSALWWECSSWSGGARRAPEHFYSTLWYWPNKRFVSLPAMLVGLITEHEQAIEALGDKLTRAHAPMPLEELPLFNNREKS